MTKPREPMKFRPAEWRSNLKLRGCTPAARCLWIEMMCLMHEAEPYGHLLVDGQPPTPTELGEVASVGPAWQIPYLLDMLEAAGLFSRTAEDVIYSPLMVREERRRQVARRNGKAGGNPKLRKPESSAG